jgi:ABC-type multidrug transport system fused ATPase/permease subunit
MEPAPELPDRLLPMLLFFLRRHWRGMALLFALPITSSLITASYSNATRRITDAVLNAEKSGGSSRDAAIKPLEYFILLVCSTLLVRIVQWTVSYHNRMPFMADIRRTVFSYVQRHDAVYFEVNLSGFRTCCAPSPSGPASISFPASPSSRSACSTSRLRGRRLRG